MLLLPPKEITANYSVGINKLILMFMLRRTQNLHSGSWKQRGKLPNLKTDNTAERQKGTSVCTVTEKSKRTEQKPRASPNFSQSH